MPRAAPVTRATRWPRGHPLSDDGRRARVRPPCSDGRRRRPSLEVRVPRRRSRRSGRRARRWARPRATPSAQHGRAGAPERARCCPPRRGRRRTGHGAQVQHQGGLGAPGVGVAASVAHGTQPTSCPSSRSWSTAPASGVDVAAVTVDEHDPPGPGAQRADQLDQHRAAARRCRSSRCRGSPGARRWRRRQIAGATHTLRPPQRDPRLARDRRRDHGVGVERQVRAVLLDRADRHQDQSAASARLGPGARREPTVTTSGRHGGRRGTPERAVEAVRARAGARASRSWIEESPMPSSAESMPPRRTSRTFSTPGLAVGGEAPEVGAADHHRAGAEGERLDDVAAAADAAVHDDLDLVADRVGDRAGPSGSRPGCRRGCCRRGWTPRSP